MLQSFITGVAAAILFGTVPGLLRFFRRQGLPWTSLCLFGAALFAAFVITLAAAWPLLSIALDLVNRPPLATWLSGLSVPLVRLVLFIPVCGGIAFLCLKFLTHTRFLAFLPDRLLWNAVCMVTAALLLFAVRGF